MKKKQYVDFKEMDEVQSFVKGLEFFHLSYKTDIGLRKHMEDRLDIRVVPDGILITICDGHGGSKCADFVIRNYPEEVVKNLNNSSRITTVLKDALRTIVKLWDLESVGSYPKNIKQRNKLFETIDEKKHEIIGNASGTTVLSCYINVVKRKCYILNLGDSRASWQTDNTVCSTVDHKPNIDDAQLVRFPIWIESDDGVNRLNGDLAVGRAVGDNTSSLTGCILREPFVYTISYEKSELKLIMASDGLWDESQAHELFDNKKSCHDFTGEVTEDNLAVVYICHGLKKKSFKKR